MREQAGNFPPLRRLDDLVRPDASSAHPDPADAAVDERANPLKIRLEAARSDVVRMAVDPAVNRGLAANLAMLGHESVSQSRKWLPSRRYAGVERVSIAVASGRQAAPENPSGFLRS